MSVMLLYAPLFVVCFQYIFRRFATTICDNLCTIICPPTQANRRRHDIQVTMAAASYLEYSNLAYRELSHMQNSYSTMGRQHKRIGYDLGYTGKLNMLAGTIDANAIVARKISKMKEDSLVPSLKICISSSTQGSQQLERIRDVLKQIVREWSVEGAKERSTTFTPIMDVLTKVPPQHREETTILVPGSGLGRLAWEIASMGVQSLNRS